MGVGVGVDVDVDVDVDVEAGGASLDVPSLLDDDEGDASVDVDNVEVGGTSLDPGVLLNDFEGVTDLLSVCCDTTTKAGLDDSAKVVVGMLLVTHRRNTNTATLATATYTKGFLVATSQDCQQRRVDGERSVCDCMLAKGWNDRHVVAEGDGAVP